MSWEVTLFYWAGWTAVTGVLAATGILLIILSGKVGWWIVNSKESVFRVNASMLCAYMYYTLKFRGDPSEVREKMRLGDYLIQVTKVDEVEEE